MEMGDDTMIAYERLPNLVMSGIFTGSIMTRMEMSMIRHRYLRLCLPTIKGENP
jgi:hypothetical protein